MGKRANGEGSFYQRASDGLWIGTLTIDGKKRSVGNKDREIAEARFRALRLTANLGLPQAISTRNIEKVLTERFDSIVTRSNYSASKNRSLGPAREDRSRTIVLAKATRGCLDCGNRDVRVLQFHHRDPSQKIAQVSASLPLEVLEQEMEKCDIVCANCHAIRHWKIRHGE